MARLELEMRRAETAHLLAFAVTLMPSVWGFLVGRWEMSAWLSLFNVVFDSYPVLLQRYNRAKMTRPEGAT